MSGRCVFAEFDYVESGDSALENELFPMLTFFQCIHFCELQKEKMGNLMGVVFRCHSNAG